MLIGSSLANQTGSLPTVQCTCTWKLTESLKNTMHIRIKGTVQRDGSGWKLVSYERSLLKREARKFSDKSARPLSCESPLKQQRHLISCWQFGSELPTREWNSWRRRDWWHCVGSFKGWKEVPQSRRRAASPSLLPSPLFTLQKADYTVLYRRVYINATQREERLWERQERCLKIMNVNRILIIVIFPLQYNWKAAANTAAP